MFNDLQPICALNHCFFLVNLILITFANSLDPYQARQTVRPWIQTVTFQRYSEFFKKKKKKQHTDNKNM